MTNKRKRKKNSKNKNNINNINNNNNSSADDVNMSFKNSNDMNQPLLDQANVDDVNGADVAEQLGSESDCFELEEFDENENLCLIPEDEYVHLMHELKHKVEPEDGEHTYIVNKRVLASRMTSMYEMLDVVIDGFTIDLVTKVLNFSIICGMGAFGWYIGSIYSNNDITKPPVCHFV